MKKEQIAPFGDIVSVKCSPYAMTNWVLQFSDRVEVLEPKEVRDEVINKVKRLNEKYGVQSGDYTETLIIGCNWYRVLK